MDPCIERRRSRRGLAVALAVTLLLSGCRSRAAGDVPLIVTLDHRWGDAPLMLGAQASPSPPGAAPIAVSRLSYYLGQFRLQRADGQWIESTRRGEPESDYARIDLSQPQTLRFEPLRVAAGDYTALEFLVGIDAARNHAGARSGALDPAHGLMWTWKSGYIFFALEGRSPASGAPDHSLTFHLGGDDALTRTVVLPLTLRVDAGAASAPLRLRVDLAPFFDGLPLDRTHTVMSSDAAAPLADRYADLFRVASPSRDELVETARAP